MQKNILFRIAAFGIIFAALFSNPIAFSQEDSAKTVTLSVSGANVRDVLQALASEFSVNITVPPGLTGDVTINLNDVGLKNAFDAVLVPMNYEWEMTDSIIYMRKKGEGTRLSASYQAGGLTLDAARAPLYDVARTIGSAAKSNIVVNEVIRDVPITISLQKVKLSEALNLISKTHSVEIQQEDGTYFFTKPKPPEEVEASDETVQYVDGKVTINATGLDVSSVLTQLGAKTGISIGIEQGVSGKVTANVNDLDVPTALQTVADLAGLKVELRNGVYQVYKPTAASAQSRTSFDVVYDDGHVTLDVAKGDLGALIKEIITKSGKDFVVYGTIRDQIDAKMDSVPLEDAMTTLLRGTRYAFRKLSNDVYMIGDKTQAAPTSIALTGSAVIDIENLKADEVLNMFPPSIPTTGIKVLKEQNAIVIKGTPQELLAVRKFVKTIDRAPPVIEIEVRVIEFSEDASRSINLSSILKGTSPSELKVEVGKLSTTLDLTTKHLDREFQSTLDALIKQGKANVRISPKISTLSGRDATINVTREEFFKVTTGNVETPLTQLEKITSGVILNITPWASMNSDRIWVKVSAEVSSPTGVSSEGLPAISARKANTEVSIKRDETLIMGGLYQNRDTQSEDRFPYLGKIPVLKYFFKKESKIKDKSELVFYITPKIITSGYTKKVE